MIDQEQLAHEMLRQNRDKIEELYNRSSLQSGKKPASASKNAQRKSKQTSSNVDRVNYSNLRLI